MCNITGSDCRYSAGQQGGIIHYADADHLDGKDCCADRCSEQRGEAGTHAAHRQDVDVFVIHFTDPAVPLRQAAAAKQAKPAKKTIAKNRSAHHEYFIDETFEAGIELTGTEVKSLRERACQLTDAFCLIRGREAWLHGVHIHPYSNGGVWNVDPDRKRRLLLHRRQIDYLDAKLRQKGLALVPLEIYFDERSRVKLAIGLARGKKLYDKRADMARRDSDREIARALKELNR